MITVSLDTETELITPNCLAPRLVCVSSSWASDSQTNLWHVLDDDTPQYVYDWLTNPNMLIVGHNISYDMAVLCAQWPELMPHVFQAYTEDRITDTMLREKLQHIAIGVYRGYTTATGKTIKLSYELDKICYRRIGIKLDKGGDDRSPEQLRKANVPKELWPVRFRYDEVREIPIADWPYEFEEYARMDAVATVALWQDQENEGKSFLEDEYRQARAAWWLHLMACWGLKTNPEMVQLFKEKVESEYAEISLKLIEAKLLRTNGTRNTTEVKARVVAAYAKKGEDPPHTGKNVKTDKDTCKESGDEVLTAYSKLSSLTKQLSTDIPLLDRGEIHVRWDLLKTGRTSTSPNIQNFPRKPGMRECFWPREGWVFASADYSQFELRTVSQLCITILGYSRLAEVLNSGLDPHLEIASRIVGCSYEDAKRRKKEGDAEINQARQAGKVANFGYPGGLGILNFIEYARRDYEVVISEDLARELKRAWLDAWPEMSEYHAWINSQCEVSNSRIRNPFSGMFYGGLTFTEAANGLYQALAASAAKNAGFLIARACYVESDSPLYTCRPVNFPHDEFIIEVPWTVDANTAAHELARLMKIGAEPFIPDVPALVEPVLSRYWSKNAEPVFDNEGRLIPWPQTA